MELSLKGELTEAVHQKELERLKNKILLTSYRLNLDCKTVRIFAYSSTREQSNKRCGTRLKTESVASGRLARFARVRLLPHALPISLLILRKKTDSFAV